ncbi:hypothetical protein D5018_14410 [Parashewanella curva]|uniref:Uncharacterized protein n=1 Tax=Parashewanella curva TaxID=2338552 RepID=A0A3L8PX51_9GAMM|nr:hypothetical protein D5018_14410 [Parashewanella curva]
MIDIDDDIRLNPIQKALLTLLSLPNDPAVCQQWQLSTATIHGLLHSESFFIFAEKSKYLNKPLQQELKQWPVLLNRDWVSHALNKKTKSSLVQVKAPLIVRPVETRPKVSFGQFKQTVLMTANIVFGNNSRLEQELTALFDSTLFLQESSSSSEKNKSAYRLIQSIHPMLMINAQDREYLVKRFQLQLTIVALLPETPTKQKSLVQLRQTEHLLLQPPEQLMLRHKRLSVHSEGIPPYQFARALNHDNVAERLNPSICKQLMQTCTIL